MQFYVNLLNASRVMSIFTDHDSQTDAQQSLVYLKGCYACKWLENVDLHDNAKFGQNILRGSIVMKCLR